MAASISSTSTQGTDSNSSTKSPFEVSSEEFLSLLVAQLKYQNPLESQDPFDSVAQFASLTQLSTLQEISGTLNQFLTKQRTDIDVASWIGRTALVVSDSAAQLADGGYGGAFQADSNTDVDLTFTSADGKVLHTARVKAPVEAGQEFAWDGISSAGPVTVTATSAGGPVEFALWTPLTGIAFPSRAEVQIETPIGDFPPEAVLKLK